MVQLAAVDHQILHDCVGAEILMVGGAKLMASLLGAKFSDMGLRTSFLGCFCATLDIAFFV